MREVMIEFSHGIGYNGFVFFFKQEAYNMENLFVSLFDVESEGYQALTELKKEFPQLVIGSFSHYVEG